MFNLEKLNIFAKKTTEPTLEEQTDIAEDTAGTRAVAKAILNESGIVTNISIFPLNIPY